MAVLAGRNIQCLLLEKASSLPSYIGTFLLGVLGPWLKLYCAVQVLDSGLQILVKFMREFSASTHNKSEGQTIEPLDFALVFTKETGTTRLERAVGGWSSLGLRLCAHSCVDRGKKARELNPNGAQSNHTFHFHTRLCACGLVVSRPVKGPCRFRVNDSAGLSHCISRAAFANSCYGRSRREPVAADEPIQPWGVYSGQVLKLLHRDIANLAAQSYGGFQMKNHYRALARGDEKSVSNNEVTIITGKTCSGVSVMRRGKLWSPRIERLCLTKLQLWFWHPSPVPLHVQVSPSFLVLMNAIFIHSATIQSFKSPFPFEKVCRTAGVVIAPVEQPRPFARSLAGNSSRLNPFPVQFSQVAKMLSAAILRLSYMGHFQECGVLISRGRALRIESIYETRHRDFLSKCWSSEV